MLLTLLAVAPKGPLDTWSPTFLALLALLFPLIGLILILSFTIDSRRLSAGFSVFFTLAAFVSALLVVAIERAHPLHTESTATFLQFFTGQSGVAANFKLEWGVVADPLSAVMLVVVSLVSLLVQFYALSSMRREDGVVRFFTVMLLSTFAMLGVVVATNYFQLFLFWALVSVCSYLLIAHWWQREEASAAAGKAFVVSALADVGLLTGIAYIFYRFGDLNFQSLAGQYTAGKVGANGLFIMALLVFVGAMGKSGQVPLHVWLPSSAQAPAPGAALMHSVTMAVCGVYLVARSYALFHASPRALTVVAVVGGVTALLGALWALFQDNLKRAIAYGTVSELGLMMLGLGIGAYGAGVFELFTHASPKALLFLAAGVVIRELRTERMTEMGGLWSRMRFTAVLLLIGLAATAGVPPFSTFWSKDAILSRALAVGNPAWIALVVAVTFLSGLYLFRIAALLLAGQTARRRRFDPERIRDAGGRMAFAMVVLAIPSVVAGVRGIQGGTDPLAFLRYPGLPLANSHFVAAGVTAVAALLGSALGWFFYARRRPAIDARLAPLPRVLSHGFYLDRLYGLGVSRGLLPAGRAAGWVDGRVLDGGIDLVGESITLATTPRSRLPQIRPQQYALGFFAALVALAALSILFGGGIVRLPA